MKMKHIPPLKSLPVFLSVCEHLNFSKAANELCVTHSAVSQSIQNLESYLGKRLFHRTTRQMTLTEDGKRYQRAIQEGINIIEQATLRELTSQQQISISIIPSLGLKWLIPRMPALQEKYPDIDLRFSTHSTLALELLPHNLDIAICYGEGNEWPEYNVVPWNEDRLVLVGSPAKKPLPDDLNNYFAEQPTIWVDRSLRDADWTHWCQSLGVDVPNNTKRRYFQSSVQAIEAAIAGLGVFVTHRMFVNDEIKAGLLAELTPHSVLSRCSYFIVSKKESQNRPEVQNVIAWLQDTLKQEKSAKS